MAAPVGKKRFSLVLSSSPSPKEFLLWIALVAVDYLITGGVGASKMLIAGVIYWTVASRGGTRW